MRFRHHALAAAVLTAVAGGASVPEADAALLAVSTGATTTAEENGVPRSVVLVNTETGRVRQIARGTAPAFSPDGHSVAYATGRGIMVVDILTGHRRTLTTGASDHDPAFTASGAAVLFNRAATPPPPLEPTCAPVPSSPGLVQCQTPHGDYSNSDDIMQVAAGGGTAVALAEGGGCLPAPPPDGGAAIIAFPDGGIGGGRCGPEPVLQQPGRASQPPCGSKPADDERATLRRATWLGRRGGTLLVSHSRLTLADSTLAPRCRLLRVGAAGRIADAMPSSCGSDVAMLVGRADGTDISARIVNVKNGRVRRVPAPMPAGASHIAWQPSPCGRRPPVVAGVAAQRVADPERRPSRAPADDGPTLSPRAEA